MVSASIIDQLPNEPKFNPIKEVTYIIFFNNWPIPKRTRNQGTIPNVPQINSLK